MTRCPRPCVLRPEICQNIHPYIHPNDTFFNPLGVLGKGGSADVRTAPRSPFLFQIRIMNTIKLQLIRTAAAVSAALAAMNAAADTSERVTTDTVRVTASRVEQELLDVPMSVSVVGAEEIERSSAQTVADLLKDVPGVQVMNDGSQGMKRIRIRGEDAFRTLVLIDGQRVSEHKSMSGAPILVSTTDIERIEVIKGPASVLYGSDAVGGVVNIITKKGGEKTFGGQVSGGMQSSNNGHSANASIYGGTNGFEYRFSAGLERADDLDTPAGEIPNTDFTSRTASAYLAYNVSPDTKVGLNLQVFDLDFNTGLSPEDMQDYADFAVEVPEWKRSKAAVFWETRNVSETLVRLRTDAYFQRSDKSMHNRVYVLQKAGSMTVDQKMDNYADNTIDQYGFSAQADFQLGDEHYLIAGYEFNYDDLSAETETHSRTKIDVKSNKYDHSYAVNEGHQAMHAVFASMESVLPADLTLTYGARYTWVESEVKTDEGEASASAAPGSGETPADPGRPAFSSHTKESQKDSRIVFNVGGVWRGIEHTAVRASWAQGFRSPNLMERYIPTSMGGGTVITNPDLKPETSDNFEVGVRFAPGHAVLDLALFYSDADDYITSVNVGGQQSVYQYRNVAKAKTHGVELQTSYRFENGFEPYASGMWMRRKLEQGGDSTYDSGAPEVSGRYGLKWTGDYEGFNLRADAYARSQSETVQYDFDSKTRTSFAGSTTLNLTGGLSFGPDDAYSLDVALLNVTDKLYKLSNSIYEAGRTVTVNFNAKF